MEPFPDAIIDSKERDLKLELLPPLRETASPKTGAVIREVIFSSKRTRLPTRLLSIQNCFVLGLKVSWLENLKFLERYNEPEGVLIVCIPKKVADLTTEDAKGNVFSMKVLGVVEEYKNLGDYAVVQCSIGRGVRHAFLGCSVPKLLQFQNSGKVWPVSLLVQGYTAIGNSTSGGSFASLKIRIIQIDATSKQKLKAIDAPIPILPPFMQAQPKLASLKPLLNKEDYEALNKASSDEDN